MDRAEVLDKFLDLLPFDPYQVQEDALFAWFDDNDGVLVAAPTGMGKTLIAEAAIYEALCTNKRLYYTSPLIALTDQKFREFQDAAERWGFQREQIGLITGNRRVNPDAPVRIVVAEILLNHLLSPEEHTGDVSGVVMDEFHYFNDRERGIVWELSLALLPKHVRVMLLSATVGNTVDFVRWLSDSFDRKVRLVQTGERRVPLEFHWVEDKLLTEHLPTMSEGDDEARRSPALVFCFNRDECWDVADRIKGTKLIEAETRAKIEERLPADDFTDGIGPKLRQMLIRGVGVHHAGVLPKHKEVVEDLFLAKLVPFVVCTETLAAGINLPARSVVLSTLLKGKPREKKLVAPSDAHQMFGRAGRPQFDTQGHVFAVAHDDDVKINKWKEKYEQIDPKSKDPGIMRARKQLEKKKPSRRATQQYWTQGQFESLIKAGPANLVSKSMIPYQVLIFLLNHSGKLSDVRAFLSKRFTTDEHITGFQKQLGAMVDNLVALGFAERADDANDDPPEPIDFDADGDEDDRPPPPAEITLTDRIAALSNYRSINPLFGEFLYEELNYASYEEKLIALEGALQMPPQVTRAARLPFDREPGPLQLQRLEPALIERGIVIAHPEGGLSAVREEDEENPYDDHLEEEYPLSLPEMLQALFESHLVVPEDIFVQPKWLAGGIAEANGDFFAFVKARNLIKNEGLVLRHLLRLVILAGEFQTRSGGDPDYERIVALVTEICQRVDARYTDHFLSSVEESKHLLE